jgi:hypothetical protein
LFSRVIDFQALRQRERGGAKLCTLFCGDIRSLMMSQIANTPEEARLPFLTLCARLNPVDWKWILRDDLQNNTSS